MSKMMKKCHQTKNLAMIFLKINLINKNMIIEKILVYKMKIKTKNNILIIITII